LGTALEAADLVSWSADEVKDCLGILGLIQWSLETKLDVWKAIRDQSYKTFL
jgi:hypothetical protein